MGSTGCFNLGSRFDLAANRIMDSTIGWEALAPSDLENLGSYYSNQRTLNSILTYTIPR